MSRNSIVANSRACEEYRYLLTHGYAEKAAVKLVGDHHRLSRLERNCLFRGIVDPSIAATRLLKIVSPGAVRGKALGVDWYNVLITVETYLAGGVLFLADDGITRDAAAVHGSWRRSPRTPPATEALLAAIARLDPGRIDVYLDAPVAFSGELAGELREAIGAAIPTAACEVSLAASADWPLKRYEGVVASSDSVVLDSATAAIDLPRLALGWRFGFSPPPLDGPRSP
jgi:hypothetical protein